MAGKRAKCPNCAQVLQIPKPPEPKRSDDDLEVLPLVDGASWQKQSGPAVQNPIAGATRLSQPARRPTQAAPARRPAPPPNIGPPPLPPGRSSPSAPAAGPQSKSIWNEVEEDDYRLQAVADSPCPKCGASMSAQAVLCIACGYNRKTGMVATQQHSSPAPKKSSPLAWLRRKEGCETKGGWRLPLFLLVFGAVWLTMGFKENQLANASSQQPETISLKKLLERGADGNPNIILTDFQICQNFVYEGPGVGNQVFGSWTSVWIPIVPADAVENTPAGMFTTQIPQALIFSKHVRDNGDLAKLQVPQLRGMITNRIASLGSKEKNLLQPRYPGIDFDRCLIFDEGREPKNSGYITGLLVLGGALALAGAGLLIRRFI